MREERCAELNGLPERPGDYVLYWMHASLRGEENHALDWAAAAADRLGLPVLALFCVMESYPGASVLHYRRLLEALEETRAVLAGKGIRLALGRGDPVELVVRAAGRAAALAADAGYLRHQRAALGRIAAAVPCRMVRIEGNVTVPLAVASAKEEWSAYTLRRRLHPHLDFFLEGAENRIPRKSSLGLELGGVFCADLGGISASPPGSRPARMDEQRPREAPLRSQDLVRFDAFLDRRLDRYGEDRSDPTLEGTSGMSEALHYGRVGPAELVRRVLRAAGERSASACVHGGAAAFIEELVVRRELAMNMAAHREDYDAPSCLPAWAARTLAEGALHPRAERYSFARLENADTSDPYWNAAQDQMVRTGRMHGHMRMYWGKRLLAWTASPEEAWAAAVRLNDTYSLDGRDPSGYAGIAWCFGKHDRPWTGRPIYGTVRYMNAAGLKRKFDADAYVRLVAGLKEE